MNFNANFHTFEDDTIKKSVVALQLFNTQSIKHESSLKFSFFKSSKRK